MDAEKQNLLAISVNGTGSLSIDAKKIKHDLLEMFSEELQESEKDMMNAIDGLRRSLTSDFRNPAELRLVLIQFLLTSVSKWSRISSY